MNPWSACLLIALGCRLSPGDGAGVESFVERPPTITDLAWSCDPERARWELDVHIEGWSAGGRLWLTRDGSYAELHAVPSIAASPDGREDRLRLVLTIVADWRAARPGQSTAFLCEPPPDGLLVVDAPDGSVSDCAFLGQGERWSELSDVPSCP